MVVEVEVVVGTIAVVVAAVVAAVEVVDVSSDAGLVFFVGGSVDEGEDLYK
jgi:8-oxo-dGTP pyrophosphatase MutT (NUDIX family)